MKSLASDNFASVHPEILKALNEANKDHSKAYGDDPWTKAAIKALHEEFKTRPEVFFVYGGTGANVCSLQASTPSFGAVICSQSAHIHVDECGAPEKISGAKLLPLPTPDGKLTPEIIERHVNFTRNEHHSFPKVLSITQSTELGTVYSVDELKVLKILCQKYNLVFHMDGARLYNAAVFLKKELREITEEVGVDILSLGGTKNGLMYGEAILVFRPELAQNMLFIRKQSMQLASKMRYISAQFKALFENQLWKKNAEHSNKMARILEQAVAQDSRLQILYPVQANAVFVKIPAKMREELLKETFFWDWDTQIGSVRWMCSHDTLEGDIAQFVARIKSLSI